MLVVIEGNERLRDEQAVVYDLSVSEKK